MSGNNVYDKEFCSPDEQQISSIGTGYIANYVSGGSTARAGATLTNRRIYFSGKVFTFVGRRLSLLTRRQIVNTRDVTGTGYDFYRPIHLIIWGFIFLIGLPLLATITELGEDVIKGGLFFGVIFAIIFFIAYFNKRRTLMFIEYAGGNIAFDVKWIQKHEQDDFMRNIHLAKDNLYSKSAVAQGFVSDINSQDDEIPEL